MVDTHFKSEALFTQPSLNVDKENGVIKGVVIVQEGIDKDNGFFTPEFLNDLIDAGNAQTQGVKSRFGHPNMCKTTLGTFIGRYKNFQTINEDDRYKVVADLHLDPITQKTQVEGKGISMWDYLLEMSENNPDMFGNSIHFRGYATYETQEIGDEEVTVEIYQLESFIASDLVDSPAATDNLFKSSQDLGVITTQFLDENPQVFELIQKDSSIIHGFFKRYANYLHKSNKKVDMSFLKKIKGLLGQTKDIDLTLANGDIVTVITDAEQPKAGDKVVDAEGKPVADGDHLLPDGKTIVTSDGEITEIKEPEGDGGEDEEKEEPTNTEIMQSIKSLAQEVKQMKSNAQTSNKENQEAIELMAGKIGEIEKNHSTLAKSIKGKNYDAPYAEQTGGKKKGQKSLYDKVQEKLNAKNQD